MKKFLSGVLLFAFLVLPAFSAAASGIDAKKSQLNGVNNNIKTKQGDIKVVKSQEEVLQDKINEITKKLNDNTASLAKTQSELQDAQKKVTETQGQLDESEKKVVSQKQLMLKRLRAMYMAGNTSYLDLLFDSKSITDFLGRFNMIEKVLKFDQDMVADMNRTKNEIAAKQKMLVAQRDVISKNEVKIQAEKKSIEQDKAQQVALYDNLHKQEVADENEISAMQAASKQLEDTIRAMQAADEAQQQEQQKTSRGGGSSVRYTGGKLLWPAPGVTIITSPFGPRDYPFQNEKHPGIDIGCPSGSTVVAAAGGIVKQASNTGNGYGNCVIIDHGNKLVTLYGHGSQVLVHVGQNVSAGQTIMISGSTGRSTGAHLHFEVRLNGTPVNPMNYLQ